VLWESSRGSCKVREWLDLIDATEAAGVRILETADERVHNPANGTDRKSLIDAASDADHESYKTHKRIHRHSARVAAAGERPHVGVRSAGMTRPAALGSLRRHPPTSR
jgi:site-specific DNA recombinase